MSKTLRITAAIVLFLHGLIHLIGTAVYLVGAYRGVALQNHAARRRLERGEAASGCVVYSGPWQPSGSVLTAVAVLARWGWWQPV